MDALERLLLRQSQLATRQQLSEAGLTPSHIRWQLDCKRWRLVLPGVIAAFSGALTRKQEITPQQIRTNPRQVLREIEEAYATRMGVPAKAA